MVGEQRPHRPGAAQEVAALRKLAMEVRNGVACEVGFNAGHSAAVMLEGSGIRLLHEFDIMVQPYSNRTPRAITLSAATPTASVCTAATRDTRCVSSHARWRAEMRQVATCGSSMARTAAFSRAIYPTHTRCCGTGRGVHGG